MEFETPCVKDMFLNLYSQANEVFIVQILSDVIDDVTSKHTDCDITKDICQECTDEFMKRCEDLVIYLETKTFLKASNVTEFSHNIALCIFYDKKLDKNLYGNILYCSKFFIKYFNNNILPNFTHKISNETSEFIMTLKCHKYITCNEDVHFQNYFKEMLGPIYFMCRIMLVNVNVKKKLAKVLLNYCKKKVLETDTINLQFFKDTIQKFSYGRWITSNLWKLIPDLD